MHGRVEVEHPLGPAARPAMAPVRAPRHRSTAGRHPARRDDLTGAAAAALAARFPVVRRLLCEDSFARVARLYALGEPPGAPVPANYGDTFPRFLRSFGPAASVDYLADVAGLERGCARARRAPDARPLRHPFAALTLGAIREARVALHPSVALVTSRFPIVTIWEANQTDDEDRNVITTCAAEAALVSRPFRAVEMRRLGPGMFEFLGALSKDVTLAVAADAGRAAAADFDIAASLLLLLESNLVINVRHDPARRHRGRRAFHPARRAA